MELQQKTAKGSLWHLARTLAISVCDFVVYAALARVLSVSEFALVIFCLLIVEFASIFARVGIAQNLIQRTVWEHSFSSSTFVFIATLSFLISILLASLGSSLAYAFHSEQAVYVVLGLSVIPMLVGLQVVFKAKLEREFQQSSVTVITSVSTLLSALIALVLIYCDYGLWALVVQKVFMNVFMLACFVYKAKFKPSISYDASHTNELLTFCIPLVYVAVLQYLNRKVNNFFSAFVLGASAFAIVSIAKKGHEVMVHSTLSSINNMIVPSMSRIEKHAKINAFYKLLELSAFIIIPCFIGLSAIAQEFILLAFGDTYASSAVLLSIACFAIFAQILTWFIPNLLISAAETKLAMNVFLYELLFTVVAASIGVSFGVQALLIASTIASYLLVPFIIKVASHAFEIQVSIMIKRILAPSIASIAMFLSILLTKQLLEDGSGVLILDLVFYIVLGVCVYTGALLLLFKKRFFAQLQALKTSIK